MSNILNKIKSEPHLLKEEDLDWIVPELLENYKSKISYLTYKAYGTSANKVALDAFTELAKTELRSACYTFLFKFEHWKTNRDINSYLLTCLNRLGDKTYYDKEGIEKINTPICPGCKYLGNKEYLFNDNGSLRCSVCTSESERLQSDIKYFGKSNFETFILYESRQKIHQCFSLHSRKGYKCPECERFLPKSLEGSFGISCPYLDCSFSGKSEDLEIKIHPVAFGRRVNLSMQEQIFDDGGNNGMMFQDLHSDKNNINADILIEIQENYEEELNTLKVVINEQIQQVKRTNSSSTILQKLSMYEAYQNMLDKYPEDMVSYLVHRKQNTEYPIQSRVFQEYVRIIENSLPYDIELSNGTKYTVYSLTDPTIQLFLGKSEYEAIISNDLIIPNNTKETYTGSVTFKFYGPCFIGLLIDVIDLSSGLSIKDKVKNYTFTQINMQDINPGTKVKVKHFRINPHYEVGSMTYLQRIRRNIVDSIYLRLNKEKRIINNK